MPFYVKNKSWFFTKFFKLKKVRSWSFQKTHQWPISPRTISQIENELQLCHPFFFTKKFKFRKEHSRHARCWLRYRFFELALECAQITSLPKAYRLRFICAKQKCLLQKLSPKNVSVPRSKVLLFRIFKNIFDLSSACGAFYERAILRKIIFHGYFLVFDPFCGARITQVTPATVFLTPDCTTVQGTVNLVKKRCELFTITCLVYFHADQKG